MAEEIVEEWRAVVGYEGLYEVSSIGNVRRLGRKCGDRFLRPRPLMPCANAYGYIVVQLCVNNRSSVQQVSRLVGRAFLSATGKFEMDHINRVRSDNRVSNLRVSCRTKNVLNTKIRSDNTSGHKGVSLHPEYKVAGKQKWCARINVSGRIKHLGTFDSMEEAVAARRCAAAENYGDTYIEGRVWPS